MTSARPPPPCACVEVVREPFACVSGAAGCVNVNRGPLVLRDGNPCGCLRVSFELTHLVLQFLCRAIHFQKSTPGTPTDLSASGAGGDHQRGAGSEERARDRQERRALVFGRKQDELVHA